MSEVKEEIELAEEALTDYQHMEEMSLRRRYNTLYYAVYHAARASLLKREYSPKTHSGLDSLVRNILCKDKEILTEEEASSFSKLKTRREQADYETSFFGSEDELKDLETKARKLVTKLKESV